MRGRTQALWVAVLGAGTLMFSWLSAAVLALVTLRKGPAEGGYLLAWAALPAGFLLAVFGDIGQLLSQGAEFRGRSDRIFFSNNCLAISVP